MVSEKVSWKLCILQMVKFLSFKCSINLDVVALSGDDHNTKISLVCVWGFRGRCGELRPKVFGAEPVPRFFCSPYRAAMSLSSLKKILLVLMGILIDLN